MVITPEQLEAVASWAPAAPAPQPRNGHGSRDGYDIDAFIAQHLPELRGPVPWEGGRKWEGTCPWDSAHTNLSFWIAQCASGAIAAGCRHDGCKGKGWNELRAMFDPKPEARTERRRREKRERKEQPTAPPTDGTPTATFWRELLVGDNAAQFSP